MLQNVAKNSGDARGIRQRSGSWIREGTKMCFMFDPDDEMEGTFREALSAIFEKD